MWALHAGVAQLVERVSCKDDVAGSTPVTGSEGCPRIPGRSGLRPPTQRSRRASNRAGGTAIASWAATSWISRVPAARVASRIAKTDEVVQLERAGRRAGRGQVGEVERGGDVAAAVGRDRQQGSGDGPGAGVGDRDDVEGVGRRVVVQHAGDQHVAGPAWRGRRRRPSSTSARAWWSSAGEEVELEVVGRDDVGARARPCRAGTPGCPAARTSRGRRRPSPGRSSRRRPG